MPFLSRGTRVGAAAVALGLSIAGPQAVGVASAGPSDGETSSAGRAESSANTPKSRSARGAAADRGVAARQRAQATRATEGRDVRVAVPSVAAAPSNPSTEGGGPKLRVRPGPSIPAAASATWTAMPATAVTRSAESVTAPDAAPTAAATATTLASAAAVTGDPLAAITDWVDGLPASPIKSLIEGALLLTRRLLFNSEPAVQPVQTFALTNGQIWGTVGATDSEGDGITYRVTSAPQFGTVSIDSGGGYTYTPGTGFTGTDSFTVIANDRGLHINLLDLFNAGTETVVTVDRAAEAPPGSVIDNFDGTAGSLPDQTIFGNNVGPYLDAGLQTYTASPDNVRLDGEGHLVIEAHQTEEGYTSARVLTQGKLDMQYGTLVARIKMPAGQGIWPSFWMLGTGYRPISGNDGWPDVGEIDIMELVNNGNTYYVTLHGPQGSPTGGTTDYYAGNGQVVGNQGPIDDLTADYHDYWLKWRPDEIIIGVDDQTLGVFTPDSLPPGGEWVFNAPMFAILQISVGGPWPGPPDSTTTWPATMMVDSFRYTPYG